MDGEEFGRERRGMGGQVVGFGGEDFGFEFVLCKWGGLDGLDIGGICYWRGGRW